MQTGDKMESMSNEDFEKFLHSFNKYPYYDTVKNISWPKDEQGNNIEDSDPLIENEFRMFSLDDICKEYGNFDYYNLPTTTDALWYKIDDDGNFVLYFIEFKWHDLNRYKNKNLIKRTYQKLEDDILEYSMIKDLKIIFKIYKSEEVLFKLRIKPFESLFIVLPELYHEYCAMNEDVEIKDLYSFLKKCEIKIYSFVSTYTRPNDNMGINNSNYHNKYKKRLGHLRTTGRNGSIGCTLKKQFDRLKLNALVDDADIFERTYFDEFLEQHKLNIK